MIAFKPQIAYFAAQRAEAQLERLIEHIREVAPQVPVILDAKRGDIGSTAEQYAREVFERYRADAVTLSPFMGFDSIEPYLAYTGKGAFLLCRTSNPGGADLQGQRLVGADGRPGLALRTHRAPGRRARGTAAASSASSSARPIPAEIERVRELAPTLPLLIPGIGAQGGDAAATVRAGARAGRADHRQLVARGALCRPAGADFAAAARRVAQATRATLNAARAA